MLILDTNIISAVINPAANLQIVKWLELQKEGSLYLCAPVLAEMRFGVALLPDGARKNRIAEAYDNLERDLFGSRVLAFDAKAARKFAEVRALRQKAGRRIRSMDALIASIALANGAALATRNTGDFDALGLALVDPSAARI